MATNTSISSDSWDKEEVLRLIGLYEHETVLWDVKLSAHKNSNTRHDALLKISNALGRNQLDVDKKLKNLRSQFFREKKKMVKSKKSGAGTDEVYMPKWFFYKLLQFLSPSVEPVSHTRTSSMNFNLPQEDTLVIEIDESIQDGTALDINGMEEGDLKEMVTESTCNRILEKRSRTSTDSCQSEIRSLNKRIKSNNKLNGIEAYEVMKSIGINNKDQDTCFGQFVAESLRNMAVPRMKSWARKEIANILYRAETETNDPALSTIFDTGSYSQVTQIDNRVGYKTGRAGNQYTQQPHQNNQFRNPSGYFNPFDLQYAKVGQQTSSSRDNYYVNADHQQQCTHNYSRKIPLNSQVGENLNGESLRPSSI